MKKSIFGDRSTSEILILVITLTVVGYIILSGVLVLYLVIFTDKDSSNQARNLADIINTLIGLLAGYLAGRSGALKKPGTKTPPEE